MDIAARLAINTELVEKMLVGFIRDGVTKAGFERVVIGLSGGIDSAVSAFLSVEALGRENVIGIRMPYATSSPASMSDAQKVADALDIECLTIPITPYVGPFIERFEDMSDMRRGNVMARMRMIILYDQSAALGGLVMGTSNKTEALLGYTTIYGDNAAAMQPIADLYKTQLRQLAAAMGVPRSVVDKPPSADLWTGQTDEDEIGYTYERLDQLLYLLVDARYRPEEVISEGFPRSMVEDVWRRVRASHFKRTMPAVAKLGSRTVGHDFLYGRDWSG